MNENKYLVQLKELILKELEDEPVKIYLYGSRARGDEDYTSDVDIGYLPKETFDQQKISLLKEKIEESSIPYKVDLINISDSNSKFQEQVLKDGILWKE